MVRTETLGKGLKIKGLQREWWPGALTLVLVSDERNEEDKLVI